jgi:hypothetical protein
MEEGRSTFEILTGGPKPTGPRRGWEDNVTILECILNRYQYEEFGLFVSG